MTIFQYLNEFFGLFIDGLSHISFYGVSIVSMLIAMISASIMVSFIARLNK